MSSSLERVRARLRRGRGDAGVGLAELLVVSLVSSILLGALGTLVAGSLSASRRTTAHTAATAEARVAMDVVARRLRVAVRPSSGGSMITQASAQVIDFYASLAPHGTTADPLPSRVRYEVSTTRRCLLETITPASGPVRETCLASGTVVPLFRYYQVTKPATSTNPSPSPAPTAELVPPPGGSLDNPDLVASVAIELSVRDPREPTKQVRMTTRVLMVNHHNEPVKDAA